MSTTATKGLIGFALSAVGENVRSLRAEGDLALLVAAKNGDARACKELVDRHGTRLLAVVTAAHPHASIADDVVQEAFIRALESADQLRQESSFFPWLVRIAIRVGYDLRRKAKREKLTELSPDLPDEDASPEAKTLASEDSLYVRRALERLKPYERELMVLRYFASFSTAELAEVFDKKEVTIRKDLQRAREKTKKYLDKWFVEGGRR